MKLFANSNIALIGMPASGKSTLGVMLAKELGADFVDTDLLIQLNSKQSLQDIVDQQGVLALREIEQDIVLGLSVKNHVIATGGSVVYSDLGMRHLKSIATVVYLKVSLAEIERRLGDFSQRGLAKSPDQTIESMYNERQSLYQQYADITIDAQAVLAPSSISAEAICSLILRVLTEGQ